MLQWITRKHSNMPCELLNSITLIYKQWSAIAMNMGRAPPKMGNQHCNGMRLLLNRDQLKDIGISPCAIAMVNVVLQLKWRKRNFIFKWPLTKATAMLLSH